MLLVFTKPNFNHPSLQFVVELSPFADPVCGMV